VTAADLDALGDDKPLTAALLADALDMFWNAALAATHDYQDSTANAVMSGMVQGMSAVGDHLRKSFVSEALREREALLSEIATLRAGAAEAARLREELLEAVRREVVVIVYRPAYSGVTVKHGYRCELCEVAWHDSSEETHTAACLLARAAAGGG
jgi:hypothetical protein